MFIVICINLMVKVAIYKVAKNFKIFVETVPNLFPGIPVGVPFCTFSFRECFETEFEHILQGIITLRFQSRLCQDGMHVKFFTGYERRNPLEFQRVVFQNKAKFRAH